MPAPEHSITNQPVTELMLPRTQEELDEYQNSGNTRMVLLATIVVALISTGLYTLS